MRADCVYDMLNKYTKQVNRTSTTLVAVYRTMRERKVHELCRMKVTYCSTDSTALTPDVGAGGGCALRTTKLACWL